MSSSKNYVHRIIDDYCVLDTETTGLSAYYDEIIEIGIVKVRNNIIVDRYSQLIKPEYDIPAFVTALTGITNDMVKDMPSVEDVAPSVMDFIGDDVIVGHNTSFDIRFLNAGFKRNVTNEYMDTMQFARKLYPELPHHRLSDMTAYLTLSNNEHRAMADCVATKELYDAIKEKMQNENLDISDLWYKAKRKTYGRIDISAITPTEFEIDEDGFFYGKHVVFTGKLEKMTRKNAMQIIVNVGGILDNGVTKKTNYLILGDNDYNAILKGEKSSKHKRAEQLKLEGQDIEILDELTFYDILNLGDSHDENKSYDSAALETTVSLQSDQQNTDFTVIDDWKKRVDDLCHDLIRKHILPQDSIYLARNKGRKGKAEDKSDITISYSLCIYEPEWPETRGAVKDQSRNKVFMNIIENELKTKDNRYEIQVRDTAAEFVGDIPHAENKGRVADTYWRKYQMEKNDMDKALDDLIEYIEKLFAYELKNYVSKEPSFGCCSRFNECSDAKECVHENKLYACACQYKKNLDAGRIFYGKNRNID